MKFNMTLEEYVRTGDKLYKLEAEDVPLSDREKHRAQLFAYLVKTLDEGNFNTEPNENFKLPENWLTYTWK